MGSYISILNDTEDDVYCRPGLDQSALGIATIAASTVGGAAAIAATAGLAAGAVIPTASALALSIASSAVAVGANTAHLIDGSSNRTQTVVCDTSRHQEAEKEYKAQEKDAEGNEFVRLSLECKGYVKIRSGQCVKFGKFTLSLWKQAHIQRLTVNYKTRRFLLQELYMRPIFSGPTGTSTNEYKVSDWMDNNKNNNRAGFATVQVFEFPPSYRDLAAEPQCCFTEKSHLFAPRACAKSLHY
jgi:hypothetical protein